MCQKCPKTIYKKEGQIWTQLFQISFKSLKNYFTKSISPKLALVWCFCRSKHISHLAKRTFEFWVICRKPFGSCLIIKNRNPGKWPTLLHIRLFRANSMTFMYISLQQKNVLFLISLQLSVDVYITNELLCVKILAEFSQGFIQACKRRRLKGSCWHQNRIHILFA